MLYAMTDLGIETTSSYKTKKAFEQNLRGNGIKVSWTWTESQFKEAVIEGRYVDMWLDGKISTRQFSAAEKAYDYYHAG